MVRKMTLFLVMVVVMITFASRLPTSDALLPDRGARHISHHTLEQEEKRNRQHVWDWLDKLYNERQNNKNTVGTSRASKGGAASSFLGFKDFKKIQTSTPNFVTPASRLLEEVKIPTRLLNKEVKKDEDNNINLRNKRTRETSLAADTSMEVDYADSAALTDDDYFDQMNGSSTVSPPKPRKTSSSLSSMLRFSSNRTDKNENGTNRFTRMSSSRSTNSDNNKKLKSSPSVLNLPPVSSDWSFTCPPGRSGWFADVSNDCRVYYVCSAEGRGERQRFSCPSGTRFSETSKNCDWWDKVTCGEDEESGDNQ